MGKTSSALRFAVLVLPALVAARPGAAEAQAPAPGDTVPAAELAPVIVEVLRTPVELRHAPVAVTVVAGEHLRQGRAGLALDEAFLGIPGVQVDNRFNYALGERISVRGFGARTQFGVRGVRVVVDGIPATFADGQSALEGIDPGALERIEVVRGPASALYGNASGGVILLRTQPPPPVSLRQELRAVGGENGMLRLESRTSGQVGATSYQLRASHLGYDGYREHSAFETRQVAGQLRRELTAGDLRLSASVLEFDAQNPGSLSRGLLETDRFQAFSQNVVQGTGKLGRQGQAGVAFASQLPGAELEISGHLQRREIVNPIPNRIIDLDRTASGARVLFRSAGPPQSQQLTWVVGGELDVQWDDRQNHENDAGERGALTLDQAERVVGGGVFTQLIVPLTPEFALHGGMRADRFVFRVRDRFVLETEIDGSGSREMHAVSPSLGVTWSPVEAFGLFANLSTAFETPTTTELANRPDGAGGFNPDLEPQRTRSFEIGARGETGGVRYQVATYRADIRNALIPFQVPEAPGRDFFRNAGTSVHRGFEAGLDLDPLPRLNAGFAYTYVDATFKDYEVRGTAFDGNRVPGVAPHRWTGRLLYRPVEAAYLGLDILLSAAVPVDDANSERAPSYTLVGARAGLASVQFGRAGLAPFVGVTNLLDTEYITAVTINAFGGRFFEPGPARALYVGMQLRADR
jgi:iron complex outermembrane recepter protein